MGDMANPNAGHDAFICVTWRIHTCDMTHSYVWHDVCAVGERYYSRIARHGCKLHRWRCSLWWLHCSCRFAHPIIYIYIFAHPTIYIYMYILPPNVVASDDITAAAVATSGLHTLLHPTIYICMYVLPPYVVASDDTTAAAVATTGLHTLFYTYIYSHTLLYIHMYILPLDVKASDHATAPAATALKTPPIFICI